MNEDRVEIDIIKKIKKKENVFKETDKPHNSSDFLMKPTADSTTIKVAPQLLNSFPNQNSKRIDYVIVYEKLGEIKKNDLKNQNKLLKESVLLTAYNF